MRFRPFAKSRRPEPLGAFLSDIGRLLPFGALVFPGGVSLSPGAASARRALHVLAVSIQPERASRMRYGRGESRSRPCGHWRAGWGASCRVDPVAVPENEGLYGVRSSGCWFFGAALKADRPKRAGRGEHRTSRVGSDVKPISRNATTLHKLRRDGNPSVLAHITKHLQNIAVGRT